jgi:hypothetical protein
MARHPRKMRDVSYLKPEQFQDWLTITEVARVVSRDVSWIRKLEREGKIPQAKRVTRGDLAVRLWAPHDVEEIQRVIDAAKPGRPKGS